ncbi:MAG: hypothetical protein ACOC38_04465, partial [Promethearchaeia archaeon]
MSDLMSILQGFKDDSNLYADLIFDSEEPMNIIVELTDTGETATLVLEREVGVSRIESGEKEADLKVTMASHILRNIAEGKA